MLLFALAACVGGDPKDAVEPKDSSLSESPADDSPLSDDSPVDSPDPTGSAPTVTDCDAFCWQHQTGDTFYQWLVECHATDPEGLEDIANGRMEIYQGSTQQGSTLVACDRAGFCTSSFRETDFGVLCSSASSYTFSVWISDMEGHESTPLVTTGHVQ